MKQTKRTLAVMVLAVTVGCTSLPIPASPSPTISQIKVYHTADTSHLVDAVIRTNFELSFQANLQAESRQQQTLLDLLNDTSIDYFITHHNPTQDRDTLWSMPLAQDGLAILKHPDNRIANLSHDELQAIYRGFITHWDELNGDNLPIVIYTREEDSALRFEFDRLVMGNQQITPNAQILTSTEQMLARITSNENAIGYIPISYLDDMAHTFSIDTIDATIGTLEDSSYPLRMTIYGIGRIAPTMLYRDLFIWIQNLDEEDRGTQFAPLPR